MKKRYPVIILLFAISISAFGQISHGGKPASFEHANLKAGIAEYLAPEADYKQMLKEDLEVGRGKPFRYGKVHNVNLSPENSGTWMTLDNGDKIWRLRIKSTGAYSLSLIFDNYKLNNGAKIFLYSVDKKIVKGAFTDENNKKDSWFSTVPIAGDEIIIELNVAADVDYGKLDISGVVHDYKGTFGLKTGYGSSGSCNVNINCPEGLEWQVEKRSVAKLLVGGYLCTGALINNTAIDAKPYLLTAEHCVSSQSVAGTAVFQFNYESASCVPTGNPSYQSISSSTIVATGGDLDFTLLELSQIPPTDYNVVYAGWNRKSTPATNTTCIHHPQGDIKKISKDNDPPAIGNYADVDPGAGYLTNSHWNIGEWDLGTTEGGSSGSPLFDENHLIIGDLTGGDASCNYNFNDYYARFDFSWDYHSDDPAKQLKTWLDPLNSGVETLAGYDPAITEGIDAELKAIIEPIGGYCEGEQIVPEFKIVNHGTDTITSFTMNYIINGKSLVSTIWTGSLKTLESTNVIFPSLIPTVGENKIVAYVSEPNASTDLNLDNDTLGATFTVNNLIDVAIEQIVHPNGGYCIADSIMPEIVIGNAGQVGITNLDINYQIDGGTIYREKWDGNLITGSETVNLDKLKLSTGNHEFKVFLSSLNCALDTDPTNDTLVSIFYGQDSIKNLQILGAQQICKGVSSYNYSTNVDANHFWNAFGGEIIDSETLPQIEVKWDEWGERYLDVYVNNLCNSVDAENLEIDVVEQGFNLTMSLDGNGETACWFIINCDGDTVAQDCDLPATGEYTTSICVSRGCYKFVVTSEASGVKSYSLNRMSDNQVVVSGSDVLGSKTIEFFLNASTSNAGINLYPNPSDLEITIEASFIELYENAKFAIFNLRGEALTPYLSFDERKVIDISTLQPGFYVVKVQTIYGEFSKKFVKP